MPWTLAERTTIQSLLGREVPIAVIVYILLKNREGDYMPKWQRLKLAIHLIGFLALTGAIRKSPLLTNVHGVWHPVYNLYRGTRERKRRLFLYTLADSQSGRGPANAIHIG